MDDKPTMRLTSMAHGGGCGCKLAPAVLQDILKKMPLPVEAGHATGAAARNRVLGLQCDPQTSGGLLVAVRASCAADVVERCRTAGFAQAAVVGATRAGAPTVTID